MSKEKLAVPAEPAIVEEKIVPFGHQLVGLDFNPSGNADVTRVKELAAEMAEILKKNYEEERGPLKSLLFDHAVGEILNAQMAVVKVITLKK